MVEVAIDHHVVRSCVYSSATVTIAGICNMTATQREGYDAGLA